MNYIQRLSSIDEQERKLAIQRSLLLKKAYDSGDVEQIFKAEQYTQLAKKNSGMNNNRTMDNPAKALMMDPQEIAASMGYYTKAASLSMESLRAMGRSPIIGAIVRTRKNQVAEFLKPQKDKYSKGFVIKKKGIEDDKEISDKDKRVIESLTEFILQCGDDHSKYKWDRFEIFGRKVIEDSLILDQACFEIIPYRNLEPYAFVAVDSGTMRIADSIDNMTGIDDSQKINGEYPSYVQVWQGRTIREFYPWELCFGIRNPTTNIRANGYGRSELEDLISTVTAMLNADRYNSGFFRHGSAPKGILMVKKAGAALNTDRIAEFRKSWNAMLSGAENAHKTPILDAEGFEWVDMQKNNRDMEFFKFIEYLVKLACANYTISPEEIGFPLEGSGNSGLGKDSGKDEKDYSLSKGLNPLLSSFERWVNDYIIGPKTNYTYEFKFVGMQVESPKDEEERLTKATTLYMTPDEVRKEKGLKPLPNGWGKMPLNPILAQQEQMKMQQQQQQQQSDQEQQDKQGEDDQQQFENTNPFLKGDESNPFVKDFNDFVNKELIVQ